MVTGKQVRVRFAPSPTGALHIGGVRTALYNYLFARKHKGAFLLRIEDTDQARFVPGAEAYIMEALQWLGISVDEGPSAGGSFGPYRQSERTSIYQFYAAQLLQTGRAYYAFDTPEALAAMRGSSAKGSGVSASQYNAISRTEMRNALTLPKGEVEALFRAKVPHVIRIKVEPHTLVRFHDLVRGWVGIASSSLDDKVLIKSDGTPTYHFANVVDDHLMHISHVIRGEEWISSTPIHTLLYQYLGWEASMPKFVHLPLLLNPSGVGKLSKRAAAEQSLPIFPLTWTDATHHTTSIGFREQGYLPDALINFLALLGWNPGTPQELFSKEELIQTFSIERISKSGARFELQKANWFNQHYLRKLSNETLAAYLIKDLKNHQIAFTPQKVAQVCRLLREQVTFPHDLWTQGKYFFVAPTVYETARLAKHWDSLFVSRIRDLLNLLKGSKEFNASTFNEALTRVISASPITKKHFMPTIRVALTGVTVGPSLMQSAELIGRQACVERLSTFLQHPVCRNSTEEAV